MTDTTITVRGTATRRVLPDIATWTAVAEGRGPDTRTAYDQCSTAMHALHAAATAAAPPGCEIAAGRIWVREEWGESGRRRTGYVAAGTVTMRGGVSDLPALGQAALEAGAQRLDGPVYTVSDPIGLGDALAAEAVVAARVRAEAMAAAGGMRVGEVLRIADEGAEDWSPAARPAALEMRSMARAAAQPGPVEPELQDVTATVIVTFALQSTG